MAVNLELCLNRVLPQGTKLSIDQMGRIEVGNVVLDRNYDRNTAMKLYKELDILPGNFIDFECDGVKLQACEDECLVQVGSFGIMQNKERVLYGVLEDNEFTSCVAVFDKSTQSWSTTVAFQMRNIDESKARSKIAKAFRNAFSRVQGTKISNMTMDIKDDESMRAHPVDQNPTGLLHFPPSFFCSTVDTEATTVVDKLKAVEHLIRFTQTNDRFTESQVSEQSMASGDHKLNKMKSIFSENKVFSTEQKHGPRRSEEESPSPSRYFEPKEFSGKNKFFFKPSVVNPQKSHGQSQRLVAIGQQIKQSKNISYQHGSRQSSSSILKKHLSSTNKSLLARNTNPGTQKPAEFSPNRSKAAADVVKVRSYLNKGNNLQPKSLKSQLRAKINPSKPTKMASIPVPAPVKPYVIVKSESSCNIPTTPVQKKTSLRRPLSSNLNKTTSVSSLKPQNRQAAGSRSELLGKPAQTRSSQTTNSAQGSWMSKLEVTPILALADSDRKAIVNPPEGLSDLVVQMENRIDELLAEMLHSSLDESKFRSQGHSAQGSPAKNRSSTGSFEILTKEMQVLPKKADVTFGPTTILGTRSPKKLSRNQSTLKHGTKPLYGLVGLEKRHHKIESHHFAKCEEPCLVTFPIDPSTANGLVERCSVLLEIRELQASDTHLSQSKPSETIAESQRSSTKAQISPKIAETAAAADHQPTTGVVAARTIDRTNASGRGSETLAKKGAKKKRAASAAKASEVEKLELREPVLAEARRLEIKEEMTGGEKREEAKAEEGLLDEADVARIEALQRAAAEVLAKYRNRGSREDKKTVRWSNEISVHPLVGDEELALKIRSKSSQVLPRTITTFSSNCDSSKASNKLEPFLDAQEYFLPFQHRLIANQSQISVLLLKGGWRELLYSEMNLDANSKLGKLWNNLEAIGYTSAQKRAKSLIETYPYQFWTHLDQLLRD